MFRVGRGGGIKTSVGRVSGNMETCGSRWRTQGIVPNGEGEPTRLTPHQRDSQPEGERGTELQIDAVRCSGRCLVLGNQP